MHYVSFTTSGAICTITLTRPDKRNAVYGPMAAELRAAFIRFEEDSTRRAAVITGAGGHFCAGAARFAQGAGGMETSTLDK